VLDSLSDKKAGNSRDGQQKLNKNMLGFFKNLFGNRTGGDSNAFQRAATPPTPARAASASFHPRVPRPSTPTASNSLPRNGNRANTGDVESINIPLAAVLNGLPPELRPHVLQADIGDATLSISLERILSQISTGAVKLTFGELRQAAPELFLPADNYDDSQVTLPLNEILSRVNPALLVRRQNQKHIEVPQEISSPFDDRVNESTALNPPPVNSPGRKIALAMPAAQMDPASPEFAPFTRKPALVASVRPTHAPAAHPPGMPLKATPPVPQAPPAQRPIQAFQPQSRPVQQNQFKPSGQKPLQQPSVPPAPRPNPVSRQVSETESTQPPSAIPVSSALRSLGASTGLTAVPPNGPSAAASVRPIAVTPPKTVHEGVFLNVQLQAVSEYWADALRKEIVQLNLSDASLSIPLNTIEEAVRRGKVAFPWKTVRSWVNPAPLPTVSVHDIAIVEFPLRVIAPLFIARKKDLSQPRSKVAIDEQIPNLFFGFPQPEAAAAAPAPAAPAPVRAQPAAPISNQANAGETNYYVWDESSDSARVDETEFKRKPSIETNFLSRHATPNEVVAGAAALDGVVGALVALPDGLMVASKLPPELNGDTLAAFLPQIFGKVSQCTKELRMGDLNNLNFTVGNVPWKIFRVNAIFFAAFGRAGEGLPTAQLATLAAQLDRKKQ
jgi:predicted regulator of Ras-like GTPase activity (Roadblock/LC7/MglB family)